MASDSLVPLAQMLATLPDESVEGLLSAFDSVVRASDASLRSSAAQLLRDTADGCANPTRRERLLRAADDIAAGQPCAVAPIQYDTAVEVPEPPPADAVEEDEDDADPRMAEAPPQLPHMPVRHFFPGLVVRVAQDFHDVHGRVLCAQDLLKVFAYEAEGDGYRVSFLERTVPLGAGQADIIENAGNAWFQPVPTAGCLEDLAEVIDRRLEHAGDEDSELDDDEYEERLDCLDNLRRDVAECQEWLARNGERGSVPKCRSGRLAADLFGRDDIVTAWIELLFAAIPVCIGEIRR
jgi:hypothetical protein